MANRRMTWAAAGMAVVLGLGIVAAAEKAPEDYVKAMKGINAANMQLRQHVTAKDYDALVVDAATLKPFAETAAKYWNDKKVEDAMKMAADFGKAIGDLATAAKAKDDAAVTAAAQAIGGSCRTCHTAHRSERLPDGTYEIK